MQLKQENFPLTVKDHLVSNEEFTLDFDAEKRNAFNKTAARSQ